MQKLGRNDPCHCGSGKKYKRCCLEKDKAANVTRIASKPEPDLESPDITSLIDLELEWANELYRVLANHFYNSTRGIYPDEEIATMIGIWNEYSAAEQPLTVKAGIMPAALEYCLCQVFGYEATQSELAAKYNVSAASISKRAEQIYGFILVHYPDLIGLGDALGGLETSTPPQVIERELDQIISLLEQQKIDSPEEIKAFLDQYLQNQKNQNKKSAAAQRSTMSKKEQAQDLLYDAWEEPDPGRKLKLTQQALELYPDSADAYNILAECAADSLREKLYYYRQGMMAGKRDLGEEAFREHKEFFWGYVPTRPYMRAKHGYAAVCAELGNYEEAIEHYTEMLELNPNDNQGVRYSLLVLYMELGQWEQAAELLKQYDEDASAEFSYGRVLVEYGLHGVTAKLRALLKQAVTDNPHVPKYLLGKKKLPRKMPEFVGFGDDREAAVYAKLQSHLWQDKPELLRLLASQK